MFFLQSEKSLKRKQKLLAPNSVSWTYSASFHRCLGSQIPSTPQIFKETSQNHSNPPQCHFSQEIRRPHCRGFLRKSLSGSYSLSKAVPFLLQCPVSASRIPSMMSHCWSKCSSLRPLSPVSKWVTWGLTRVENFPEIVNPWYGIYIYYAISRPMTYIYINTFNMDLFFFNRQMLGIYQCYGLVWVLGLLCIP